MRKFFNLASLGFLSTFSAAETNEVGKAYLEERKKDKDVIELPSGLLYKVLKKGSGKFSPYKDTSCECHYAGTTPSLTENPHEISDEADWKEFDSSYKRGEPTSFAPNQVIKGWTEAMQLMKEGDKWEMYIPSELGYGENGTGDKIKGGDVLVFRMEMLNIKGKKKRVVKCNFETEEGCDEEELAMYKPYKDMNADQRKEKADEVKKEIDELEERMKKPFKKDEFKGVKEKMSKLKQVYKIIKPKKSKKKTEEL